MQTTAGDDRPVLRVVPVLADEPDATGESSLPGGRTVVLSDDSECDLSGLSLRDLHELQWREEQAFARAILRAVPRSRERKEATCQGYDTVCTILAEMRARRGGDGFAMGFNAKYVRLVVDLLQQQRRAGIEPSLFEIGYGPGVLLRRVYDAGFPVAGIEVSSAMQRLAHDALPSSIHPRVLLGDFLDRNLSADEGRFSLVYWNDVCEHVPPDEILDYLWKIHKLLAPGGCLVTLTPNWHVRPSDVTFDFRGPRVDPAGFHLKEYTLNEMTALLRAVGFSRVVTPLVVTRRKIVIRGGGLAGLKRLFEPALEWLPFRLTEFLCRGLGLACTIATRG
jgi:SAM-dependent methyltransferase